MSNIPNLASLARLRLWSWGWSTVRRKAFWFDWVNDYISSNATIGRTGYDMNVSGNVTTGSDGDGSYIQFNGSYRRDLTTWSIAKIWGTSYAISQAWSFSCSCIFKVSSFAIDNNTSWLFWINSVCSIYMTNNVWWAAFRIRNGASFVDVNMSTLSTWTLYKCHLVYDASVTKIYCYVDWVLQNSWGTSVWFSFSWSGRSLWDDWVWWWNHTSSNKYIYHSAVRNKALTQAEIDADIALWNTTKQDPSIVAYYIPENLQYNTQYWTNPNTFGDTWWTIGSNASVITNNAAAPDWTTTASTYTINVLWTAVTNAINQNVTTISWSSIASKTFIVKAFVRVTSWSNSFRLQCSHTGVADYYSWNQTATTTRQEFTFTQTFTSSTSWTGIRYWLTSDTLFSAWAFQVAKVRLFLVNQTLRDESPNIWWFIGWKTQQVLSCWTKLNADSTDTANAFALMVTSYLYVHIRGTNNAINFRYDSARIPAWSIAAWYVLWNWFRDKVQITAVLWFVSGVRTLRLYTWWILRSTVTITNQPPTTNYNTSFWMWRKWSNYFSWNEWDIREYTFTWSFTDADALAIYNWWEPTSAWVTKYLHYRPPVGEVWTTTQDQSSNDRDWTLNNGVTRVFI